MAVTWNRSPRAPVGAPRTPPPTLRGMTDPEYLPPRVVWQERVGGQERADQLAQHAADLDATLMAFASADLGTPRGSWDHGRRRVRCEVGADDTADDVY